MLSNWRLNILGKTEADKIWKYFSFVFFFFFSKKKKALQIVSKANCQNKKNISKYHLLNFLPSMLRGNLKFECWQICNNRSVKLDAVKPIIIWAMSHWKGHNTIAPNTVFHLITAYTLISAQSSSSVVFRLQPVYFLSVSL